MSDYRRYTARFLFRRPSPSITKVLLVRKTHPKWQAGLMNAIGGEIEGDEQPNVCMRREFFEETGLDMELDAWQFFCREAGPGYEVYFYRATLDTACEWQAPAANDKEEELEWVDAHAPKYPVVGNLNWLIPLALDPRPISVGAYPRGDIREIKTW